MGYEFPHSFQLGTERNATLKIALKMSTDNNGKDISYCEK